MTLSNLGSDGWLVITGKWRAFALQHSILAMSLVRAGKETEKKKGANVKELKANLNAHRHTLQHGQT